jgi:hypothetical protein
MLSRFRFLVCKAICAGCFANAVTKGCSRIKTLASIFMVGRGGVSQNALEDLIRRPPGFAELQRALDALEWNQPQRCLDLLSMIYHGSMLFLLLHAVVASFFVAP